MRKIKRLLIVEGEFISPLKVMGRQGNILSPVIRNAWDSGNLNILTKNSPAQATDAHVSIIGHITRDELLSQFNRIEMANGFGNRFLWVCAKRSQVLPEGGSMNSADIEPLTLKLKQRVQFSSSEREITFEGFNLARCGSIYRDEVERSQSCNG